MSITPAAGVALGDIAQASQQIIDNLEDVPQDVSLYIGGNYEDQQESFSSLIWLLLLSLMLVYIVMALSSNLSRCRSLSCWPFRLHSQE